MPYRIRIEELTTKESFESAYERITDTGNEKDGGATYGYTKKPCLKETSVLILDQTVNELDMTRVIKSFTKQQ